MGLLLGTNSETPARLRSDIFSALLIPLHSVSGAVLDLFSHDLLFGVLALLPNVDVPSFPLLGNIHKWRPILGLQPEGRSEMVWKIVNVTVLKIDSEMDPKLSAKNVLKIAHEIVH